MSGTFHWNLDRTRLEVRPAAPLDPSALHLLELGADARDARGLALGGPVRAVFATGAAPVAFTVAWNADRTEATLTPTAPLAAGGRYELALAAGACSATCRALAPVATSFRCRSGGSISQG